MWTYIIFEAFQILFPAASLIFIAVKLFHQVIWERMKHIKFRRFASIMVDVVKNLNNYTSGNKLLHVYILRCLNMTQNKKSKQYAVQTGNLW